MKYAAHVASECETLKLNFLITADADADVCCQCQHQYQK